MYCPGPNSLNVSPQDDVFKILGVGDEFHCRFCLDIRELSGCLAYYVAAIRRESLSLSVFLSAAVMTPKHILSRIPPKL